MNFIAACLQQQLSVSHIIAITFGGDALTKQETTYRIGIPIEGRETVRREKDTRD
jgi:hypothetical protein